MIKNKFYSLMTSAAVLTTLAGAPLTAVIANAANTTSDQTAQVEFTGAPNGPEITTTTPNGPDDIPGNEDDNITGDALAPSFGFGPHALTGAAQNGLTVVDNSNRTTDKVTGDKSANKVLSMTDNSGKGAGYTVTAQLDDFTDGTHTLPTAVLNINAAGAVSSNPAAGTVDGTPKASSVKLTAAGDAGTVLTAAMDQGMGTYTTDLSTGTTLDVPNAQYAGKYVAPLTYTVATTPVAGA